MSAGIGAFVGISGDNKPHKHWAHQLVVALNGEVEVVAGGTRYRDTGLWIPAGELHQLGHAEVVSLYVDPTHQICSTLFASFPYSGKSVSPIGKNMATELVQCVSKTDNLQSAMQTFQAIYHKHQKQDTDIRLNRILSRLKKDVTSGTNTPLSQLAELVCLSPSRFSHWFAEQTGLPLRSYKKWLKLLVGFELSRQMPLADAATTAGFSDQAHFCRTITQAFGVSSTTIIKLLSEE